MPAAEVEEIEGLFDRINRIYKIKIVEFKKPLDVGDFDRWAAVAKVGADPPSLGFASSNERLCASKTEALNRPHQPFLPSMVPKTHWIITRFWHPVDTPTPKSRPPKTRQPSAVNPHFIGRPQLENRRPG